MECRKNLGTKLATTILCVAGLGMAAKSTAQQKVEVVKHISVKGSVKFIDPNRANVVTLSKVLMNGKTQAIDSVVVDEQHKTFSFQLNQDHQGIYRINASFWDQCEFWSDANVVVNMRGYDTARYHVKIPNYNFVHGSMDNNFINFATQIGELNYRRMIDEYNEMYYAKQHKSTDSTWVTYLSKTKRYDSLSNDYTQRMDVLMNAFHDRPVLIYRLRGMTGTEDTKQYDKAMSMLNSLIQKYPWLTEAKEAKQAIITNRLQAQKVANGQPLPEASFLDVNGNKHSLDKYKGHYLLIDFWASWCGPCRAAIPKVKELYNKYHPSKGFNVVSVSIDDSKTAWKKAMDDEKMPWQQLLSPNKDTTMKQFQFSGIPTMYLISPEGNIVEKYLGYGPDTEKAIKAILEGKVKKGKKKVIKAMGMF